MYLSTTLITLPAFLLPLLIHPTIIVSSTVDVPQAVQTSTRASSTLMTSTLSPSPTSLESLDTRKPKKPKKIAEGDKHLGQFDTGSISKREPDSSSYRKRDDIISALNEEEPGVTPPGCTRWLCKHWDWKRSNKGKEPKQQSNGDQSGIWDAVLGNWVGKKREVDEDATAEPSVNSLKGRNPKKPKCHCNARVKLQLPKACSCHVPKRALDGDGQPESWDQAKREIVEEDFVAHSSPKATSARSSKKERPTVMTETPSEQQFGNDGRGPSHTQPHGRDTRSLFDTEDEAEAQHGQKDAVGQRSPVLVSTRSPKKHKSHDDQSPDEVEGPPLDIIL